MDIGIIGAGSVAQAFARHALKVGHTINISNSRGPSTLGETVQTLGSGVTAVTKEEAAASEIVVLAVPWDDVVGVLTHLPPWQQQILIDATNPFHGRAGTFTPADVHGLSTSQFVAQLGYFCPTPENVKSAHLRFLLLLETCAPVPWIAIAGRQGIKVHG